MKRNSNLINYNIFSQRKKFNVLNVVKSNELFDYEKFCSFFVNIKVEPPSEDYFKRVMEKINLEKQESEKVKIKKQPIKEPLSVVEKKPAKTTTRRRRKKTTKQN
jgi:hypothetical protein